MKQNIFEKIRQTCKNVAEKASFVRINYEYISQYADQLPLKRILCPELNEDIHYIGHGDGTLIFFIILDTINFGSGYFPYLNKLKGKSGYFTIAKHLKNYFLTNGTLSPLELTKISTQDCCRIFCQDIDNKVSYELMNYYSKALNDLGKFLTENYNDNFINFINSSDSKAEKMISLLIKMPFFNDKFIYKGQEVFFLKRAQILVSDLNFVFNGKGYGFFQDINNLTIFADNLVSHVLKLDGILIYDNDLELKIKNNILIESGSDYEIEIRACAVYAVELIKKELNRYGNNISSAMIDNLLWNKGQNPFYKASPRHRTRCVYY